MISLVGRVVFVYIVIRGMEMMGFRFLIYFSCVDSSIYELINNF